MHSNIFACKDFNLPQDYKFWQDFVLQLFFVPQDYKFWQDWCFPTVLEQECNSEINSSPLFISWNKFFISVNDLITWCILFSTMIHKHQYNMLYITFSPHPFLASSTLFSGSPPSSGWSGPFVLSVCSLSVFVSHASLQLWAPRLRSLPPQSLTSLCCSLPSGPWVLGTHPNPVLTHRFLLKLSYFRLVPI